MLCAPVAAVTYLGERQWPVVAMLVVSYAIIAIHAVRHATPGPVEPITVAVVGAYAACFMAMVRANVAIEGRITLYVAVQSSGLALLCLTTALPALRRGRTGAPRTDVRAHGHVAKLHT